MQQNKRLMNIFPPSPVSDMDYDLKMHCTVFKLKYVFYILYFRLLRNVEIVETN